MANVLVIGSGGREAAVCRKLRAEGHSIFCAPGNGGIGQTATTVPISPMDFPKLIALVRDERILLTIVGPEAPLAQGIVDAFRSAGLRICGPTKEAARAEASKIHFKGLLERHGLPTAPYRVFMHGSYRDALLYVQEKGPRSIVIKADGLRAGKGVHLPECMEEAEVHLRRYLLEGLLESVLIEDRLRGVERSAIGITDGLHVRMFPYTQDYKREHDGDRGRNTGGMGAHTVDLPREDKLQLQFLTEKVVRALLLENVPYSGFMYLGIMMTERGPMILECNARLGDPEAQAILASTDVSFFDLCMCAAMGEQSLAEVPAISRARHALCLVLTSGEYPEVSHRDDVIEGLERAKAHATVLHAGTTYRDRVFRTGKGGRLLNVVTTGENIAQARERAYASAAHIQYPNKKLRTDIGR